MHMQRNNIHEAAQLPPALRAHPHTPSPSFLHPRPEGRLTFHTSLPCLLEALATCVHLGVAFLCRCRLAHETCGLSLISHAVSRSSYHRWSSLLPVTVVVHFTAVWHFITWTHHCGCSSFLPSGCGFIMVFAVTKGHAVVISSLCIQQSLPSGPCSGEKWPAGRSTSLPPREDTGHGPSPQPPKPGLLFCVSQMLSNFWGHVT